MRIKDMNWGQIEARAAEMMQSDLSKVGIKVNIVSYEWGEYMKKAQEKDRKGAVIMGWIGDNGDPDNFLAELLSCQAAKAGGGNLSQWCDKKFDDDVVQASETVDQKKRKQLYDNAQIEFKKEAPWATLAHSTQYVAMQKNVAGFVMSPLGSMQFDHVDIAQ